MAANRSAAREKGAPGVKALLTSGALAATLAGWATLSANMPPAEPAQAASIDIDAPVVVMAPPPAWLRARPSITALPAVATVQPAGDAPLIATRPQAAPPAAAAPAPAPALREVSAPPPQPTARPAAPAPAPAPVTRTRSSR